MFVLLLLLLLLRLLWVNVYDFCSWIDMNFIYISQNHRQDHRINIALQQPTTTMMLMNALNIKTRWKEEELNKKDDSFFFISIWFWIDYNRRELLFYFVLLLDWFLGRSTYLIGTWSNQIKYAGSSVESEGGQVGWWELSVLSSHSHRSNISHNNSMRSDIDPHQFQIKWEHVEMS